MSLAERMNEIINHLGLRCWTVVWDPDHTHLKRGQVYPKTRTILIHDEEPDAALETLIHEVLEVKLRSVVQPCRVMANALIQAFDEVIYEQKEKFLNELVPHLVHVFREATPTPCTRQILYAIEEEATREKKEFESARHARRSKVV